MNKIKMFTYTQIVTEHSNLFLLRCVKTSSWPRFPSPVSLVTSSHLSRCQSTSLLIVFGFHRCQFAAMNLQSPFSTPQTSQSGALGSDSIVYFIAISWYTVKWFLKNVPEPVSLYWRCVRVGHSVKICH